MKSKNTRHGISKVKTADFTKSKRMRLIALFALAALMSTAAFSSTAAAGSIQNFLSGASSSAANLLGFAGSDTPASNQTANNGKSSGLFGFLENEDPTEEIKVATVATDRTDYAPGDFVTITGAGWQPGERVKLTLHKERDGEVHDDIKLEAIAYHDGTILNATYAPEETDYGMWYKLAAEGEESGLTAVTTFTDAITATASVSISTATLTPCQDSQVVFTAGGFTGFDAGGSVSYEWFRGSASLGTGTRTITANNTLSSPAVQLVIPSFASVNNGNYTLVMENSTGKKNTVTSNVLTLSVTAKPTITTQPAAAQTATVGQTVNFSIVASGPTGSNFTYQWKKDGADLNNSPNKISGAQSSTLTLSNVKNTGGNDDNGTYTVVVTSNGTSCGTVSITSNPSVLTVSGATTAITTQAAAGSYNGTANLSATFTSGGSPLSGANVAFTLQGGKTFNAVTNSSGVATVSSVDLTDNSGNAIAVNSYSTGVTASYNGVSASNSLTVTQADTTAETSNTFVYNGQGRSANVTVKGPKGENTQISPTDVKYAPTGANSTPASTLPVNAGDYDVFVSHNGNANYKSANSLKAVGQLKIAQADAVITVNNKTVVYNGDQQSGNANAKGINNEDLGTVNLTYSQNNGNPVSAVNAGTYDVTASFPGNGNYKNSSKVGAGALVITQADAVITANGGNFTYNGNPQGGSANAKGVKNEDLSVSINYTEGANSLEGAPVDAGTYTLTASFPGNGNYKGSSKTAQVKINPADAVITANGGQFTYNGDPQGGNGNAKGVKNEDLAVSISYTEGQTALQGAPVNAGTYNVNVSLNSNRNYNAASKSATITIGQADATVEVTGGTFDYTGDPQGGNGKAKGIKDEDLSVNIGYSEGATAIQGAPSDAGTYSVKASFGGNRNYKAAEKSAQIVIKPVDPTIEGTVGALTYNGSAQGGNGGAKGVKGENLSGASISYFEGATALQGAPKDAGSYSMDVSYPGSRNYNAKSKKFDFSIGQANSDIDISDVAGEFNGNGHHATANVRGIGNEVPGQAAISYLDLTDNVVVEAPINAGAYKAVASFGGSRNYKSSSKEAKINIGQATPTIDDFGGGGADYDGNGHGVSTKVRGIGNSALGDASISYVDTTPDQDTTGKTVDVPVNAGTYNATASFGGNRNYRAANKSGKITILPIEATITVDEDPNADYDGSAHTIKGKAKGVNGVELGDASITYIDDTTGQPVTNPTDAGHYTATAKFNGNRNYKAGNKGGGVTIKQVDSTIDITGGPFNYDGNGKSAAVSVKGVKGEDLGAADVTYTDGFGDKYATAPVDADTWTVSASHNGNRNYKKGNKSGQIKINPVDASFDSSVVTEVEYNGTVQGTTLDVRGKKGEQIPLDGDIQYFLSDANGNPTGNSLAPFNVGDYIPTGKITGAICHPNPAGINRCYKNYNPGIFKRRHKIRQAKVTVNVVGGSVQYSDQVTVQVKITGNGNVQKDINDLEGALSFQMLNSTGTTAVTPQPTVASSSIDKATGVLRYTVKLTILNAPGAYILKANFAPTSTNLLSGSGQDGVTVTKEDARAYYTGADYAATSSTSSSTATVTLSATIKDITAETGDPAYDAFPGDIRNATVKFVNRDAGNALLCTASGVGLVNSGDTKVGTATCNASLSTGSGDSQSYTIGIIVDGYYTRDASFDNGVVTVSKPVTGLVTGGGYLVMSASGGLKAGTAGLKNNFGFNIKSDSKQGPKGNINVIVRRLESDGIVHVYQLKGNAMTSLSQQVNANPKTATFNGKANIQDITDPLNVVSVDGNASLQVVMTDAGEPGSSDKIAITLLDKNGGLWFSSNWNGTTTVQQLLNGGNIQVR